MLLEKFHKFEWVTVITKGELQSRSRRGNCVFYGTTKGLTCVCLLWVCKISCGRFTAWYLLYRLMHIKGSHIQTKGWPLALGTCGHHYNKNSAESIIRWSQPAIHYLDFIGWWNAQKNYSCIFARQSKIPAHKQDAVLLHCQGAELITANLLPDIIYFRTPIVDDCLSSKDCSGWKALYVYTAILWAELVLNRNW